MTRYEIEIEITPNGDEDYDNIKVVVFDIDDGDQHRSQVGEYVTVASRVDHPYRDAIADLIRAAL